MNSLNNVDIAAFAPDDLLIRFRFLFLSVKFSRKQENIPVGCILSYCPPRWPPLDGRHTLPSGYNIPPADTLNTDGTTLLKLFHLLSIHSNKLHCHETVPNSITDTGIQHQFKLTKH